MGQPVPEPAISSRNAGRPFRAVVVAAFLLAVVTWPFWMGADSPARAANSPGQSTGPRYAEVATWPIPRPTAPFDADRVAPTDVALGADGRLYVVDGTHNAIVVYAESGALIDVWTEAPSVPAPYCGSAMALVPAAIAGQGEVLYVIWNAIFFDGIASHALFTFLQLRSWNGFVIGTYPLPHATATPDVVVYGDAIYVATDSQVEQYFLDNTGLLFGQSWPIAGAGLRSLAVTTNDLLLVVNSSGQLHRYASDGGAVGRVELGAFKAVAVAPDEAGGAFVLVEPASANEPDPRLILTSDDAGRFTGALTARELGVPPLPVGARWPFAIDSREGELAFVTADDRLWVHRRAAGGRVTRGRLGPFPGSYVPRRVPNAASTCAGAPLYIASGSQGNAYLVDTAEARLLRFAGDGTATVERQVPYHAQDLAVDEEGALFVTTGTTDAEGHTVPSLLLKYPPGAAVTPTWQVACNCELGGRLALGRDRVYATRAQGKRVAGFETERGSAVAEWGLAEAVGLWPSDLAADAGSGDVYTADLLGNAVERWTRTVLDRPEATPAPGQTGGPFKVPAERWPAGLFAGPWRIASGSLADGTPILALLLADGAIAVQDGRDGSLVARFDPNDAAESDEPFDVTDLAVDGSGRILVADATNRLVRVFDLTAAPSFPADPGRPTATPSPSPTPSRRTCRMMGDKRAEPGRVRLGDSVRVTLTLAADCPGSTMPTGADVILLLDRSASMEGEKLIAATRAAQAFVEFLDVRVHRVGLVAFGDQAQVVVPLTTDGSAVIQGLKALRAGGGTHLAAAIAAADAHLAAAGRPAALPIILLLTDGRTSDDPRRPAETARNRGVQIYAVGLGSDVGHDLLRAISAGRYFPSPTPAELFPIYREILRLIGTSFTGNLILDDQLAADLPFVAGSANPPAWLVPGGLRWGRTLLPTTGITLAYSLRPTRTGRQPVSRQAVAAYTDADGASRSYTFPIPEIEVWAPTPTPTDRPTNPPTATVTPAPTATPLPRPAYLPIAIRESCQPSERRLDVALVIDASTSMLEPIAAGGSMAGAPPSKLDAARQASRTLLDLLRWDRGDRAAVIAFNDRARLLQPLTSRRDLLDAALDAIQVGPTTRPHLGILLAADQLFGSARRPEHSPVLILLTDGRANPDPVALAEDAAARAKAGGAIVFTVGLGEDLDLAALAAMASRPAYFYRAPDAAALAEIYRRIAGTIPCPGAAFWGRR